MSLIEALPDRPLTDDDLETIGDHPNVQLARGAEYRWHVEWDRDYATTIVIVTTSRAVGLRYRPGEGGWSIAWSDDVEEDEHPDPVFMVALETMGLTDLPGDG
jgi:hypothetical protein